MADIRDPWQFIWGRWAWRRGGYENVLPRGAGIGDIDGHLELSGHHLVIESKHWDGDSGEPGFHELSTGQRMALLSLLDNGTSVLLLYGCAACNRPEWAEIRIPGRDPVQLDWRHASLDKKRAGLRAVIKRWAELAETGQLLAPPTTTATSGDGEVPGVAV